MNENQRVILITGASRGIGRAIALHLAQPGVVLLLNHYDPDPGMAEQTLSEVQAKGAKGKICYFNVAKFQEVQSHVDGLH